MASLANILQWGSQAVVARFGRTTAGVLVFGYVCLCGDAHNHWLDGSKHASGLQSCWDPVALFYGEEIWKDFQIPWFVLGSHIVQPIHKLHAERIYVGPASLRDRCSCSPSYHCQRPAYLWGDVRIYFVRHIQPLRPWQLNVERCPGQINWFLATVC